MEKHRWISVCVAVGFLGTSLVLSRPATADLSAGLVGYYLFNGNGHDNSGRSHHARPMGTGWTNDRSTGVGGQTAVSFPATGGPYVRIDNTSDFNFGTGDFSFSIWLKYSSQNTGSGHLYSAVLVRSGNSSAPWEGASVFADVTPGRVRFRVTANNQLDSIASNLNDNTWRHYAFVREGGLLKIYINGALDASVQQSVQDVSSTAPLYLGANHVDQTAQNFIGAMDELRIYDRALSTEEIQTLAGRAAVHFVNGDPQVNLQANRFQVSVSWGSGGSTQPAKVNAGATTDQTAYFYWTDPGNTEVIVKLLDFCSVNNTWSVYANGVTDREVQISITDRYSSGGTTWTGSNPLGNGFSLIRQVAFPCP